MAKDKIGWSRSLDCPIYAGTGNDSAFWFSPDVEALFAAEGILGANTFSLYRTVFGDEKIESLHLKYRMISELRSSFTLRAGSPSIFECLQGFDVRGFSLAAFRNHVLSIDKAKLPGILLDMPVNSIEDLIQNDQELLSSYMGAAVYFNCAQEFAEGIFALAEEIRTDAFYSTLDRYKRNIEEALNISTAALSAMTPQEYSDKLMHNNMWRRGPYSFFAFAPTVFCSTRAVRYIGDEQFLFFAIEDAIYDNELILRQLKALADDTRFRIVALLKERGNLKGSDIAHMLRLSASTVSHHVRVLREAGLMHEEVDGATKFYSLPANMAQEVTDALKEFLQ